MEITTSIPQPPQPQSATPAALPGAHAAKQTTELPPPATVQEAPKTQEAAVQLQKQSEQDRFQSVRKAATALRDVFVVSDKIFTIFKDSSGQFITRFTSLRDGKVTYYPEPDILAFNERLKVKADTLVQVDA